jgi:hypothetical protein
VLLLVCSGMPKVPEFGGSSTGYACVAYGPLPFCRKVRLLPLVVPRMTGKLDSLSNSSMPTSPMVSVPQTAEVAASLGKMIETVVVLAAGMTMVVRSQNCVGVRENIVPAVVEAFKVMPFAKRSGMSSSKMP